MEWIRTHILRKSRKLTDILPIAAALAVLLIILGDLVFEVAAKHLSFVHHYDEEGISGFEQMLWMYLLFLGIWPVVGLAIIIPPYNRRILRDILPNRRGNRFLAIVLGCLGGFAVNAVCILVSLLRNDIGLSFAGFEPLPLLALFGAVTVQSGAEEIVCRQYLYEKLRRRYKSPWVAILGNACVFAALHLGNQGIDVLPIAQIVTVGVLFSLFVYYFDSLWAAIFFHTSWNFTQNIIFGCPNSGAVSAYSIFRLDAAASGPFFDPAFGVEGSAGAVALLALLTVGVLVFAKAQRLETQDLWADLNADQTPTPHVDQNPEKPDTSTAPATQGKHFTKA